MVDGYEKCWMIGVIGGGIYFDLVMCLVGLVEVLGLGVVWIWDIIVFLVLGLWVMVSG